MKLFFGTNDLFKPPMRPSDEGNHFVFDVNHINDLMKELNKTYGYSIEANIGNNFLFIDGDILYWSGYNIADLFLCKLKNEDYPHPWYPIEAYEDIHPKDIHIDNLNKNDIPFLESIEEDKDHKSFHRIFEFIRRKGYDGIKYRLFEGGYDKYALLLDNDCNYDYNTVTMVKGPNMEDRYLAEETDDEINDNIESEEKSVNINIENTFDTYFDKFNNGDLDATLSKAASKTIDAIANLEDCSKDEAKEIWNKYAQEKGLHIPELAENLNEDWYSEDDSYFSREELNEFGNNVAEYMMDVVRGNFISYDGAYMEKNEIELTMSESEWELEETIKFKIDFRKIKKPSDLNKYIPAVASAVAKKFAQDGVEDFKDFDDMTKSIDTKNLPEAEFDDIEEDLDNDNFKEKVEDIMVEFSDMLERLRHR